MMNSFYHQPLDCLQHDRHEFVDAGSLLKKLSQLQLTWLHVNICEFCACIWFYAIDVSHLWPSKLCHWSCLPHCFILSSVHTEKCSHI